MSKTLLQLRTDVRSHVDEPEDSTTNDGRQYSNAEINRWINEGVREIARRTEVLQDETYIQAQSGIKEYPLPDDMIRLHRVTWLPAGGGWEQPLSYKDYRSMDEAGWTWGVSSEGWPAVWTMWGHPPNTKLVAYPTPSEAGQFKIGYYRHAKELDADTEVVDLPTGWEDLAVLYAEYLCLRKDADGRWQEAHQLFEKRLGELVDMTRRWIDQAGSVEWAGTYLPGWLWGDSEGW